MTMAWKADSLVSTRSENLDRYKLNFLKQAVCEFRFPTLMELGDTRPPMALVTALRKEYPHLELANQVTIGVGATSGSSNAHIFRSAKLNWTVSLNQSSLSIETTSYPGFLQMRERILRVVDAAAKVIDSDFFTRIGLRYINIIDIDEDPVYGWVNPKLVETILSRQFKGIQEYAGRLLLQAEDGGCLLQHGIRIKQSARDGKPSPPEYLIDIDAHRKEVALSDTAGALDMMHSQAFDIFDWCLDDKARKYLSKEAT